MSLKEQIKFFFNKYYWRQHPDAALRYLPVVSVIKALKLEESKILEIGSGSLGIIPYLKRPIDGLDIDFSGPKTKLLNKIRGSTLDLPFKKNSYDIVLSVDVIEHLPKEKREQSVLECLRVAKKLAIIVVPIGSQSEAQDIILYEYWKKIFKSKDNLFLREHTENKLPTGDEILVYIDRTLRKLNKKAKITSRPLLNLFIRNMLMRTWITKNKLLYYIYLKGYLLILPLLKHLNFGSCYRRIFVIEFLAPQKLPLEPSKFTLSKVEGDNSEKAKGKVLRGAP